jgi:hypothetical protein
MTKLEKVKKGIDIESANSHINDLKLTINSLENFRDSDNIKSADFYTHDLILAINSLKDFRRKLRRFRDDLIAKKNNNSL